MAPAGRVQALAIGADDAGAVDDVVLAVAIDVAGAEAVVPLAAIGAVCGRAVVAVEGPDAGQLAAAPVPGRQHAARVIPPAKDDAGPYAVEVGDARQEAV